MFAEIPIESDLHGEEDIEVVEEEVPFIQETPAWSDLKVVESNKNSFMEPRAQRISDEIGVQGPGECGLYAAKFATRYLNVEEEIGNILPVASLVDIQQAIPESPLIKKRILIGIKSLPGVMATVNREIAACITMLRSEAATSAHDTSNHWVCVIEFHEDQTIDGTKSIKMQVFDPLDGKIKDLDLKKIDPSGRFLAQLEFLVISKVPNNTV